MRIRITVHCTKRLLARGLEHGLEFTEARRRLLDTIRSGRCTDKHSDARSMTYTKYFHDNLSVFAICRVKQNITIVKTVIIKRGRP